MIANLLSNSCNAENLLSDSFFNSRIVNWFLIGKIISNQEKHPHIVLSEKTIWYDIFLNYQNTWVWNINHS